MKDDERGSEPVGNRFDDLRATLETTQCLSGVGAVLTWESQTYMPRAGAAARSEQMATVSRLSHEIFTSGETGDLIEDAAVEIADLPYDSDESSLVRVARREYQKSRRIPSKLVADIRRQSGLANPIWAKARQENDFASFAPCLQRTIELNRELAEHLGYEEHMYDALLDNFEPGMRTSQVRQIFGGLNDELVPLVQAISGRSNRVDSTILCQPFDEAKQESFGRMVAERYGYDFSRGRMDRTTHPFAIPFSVDDVRITTRYDPNFLAMSLFGTMHESGHAIFEQGVSRSLDGTPLARGASLGLHESQSRLWENVVGRSHGFWEHFFPELQNVFPEQLRGVDLNQFYAAINEVKPSLIRVESDEVTYNLHIMLRFEMEIELLEGAYSVAEAPGVWNQRMHDYLGTAPSTDALGILQDVHWSSNMGYFPTYALGNILSVQLYDAAVSDMPNIPRDISEGSFESLRSWMTEKVYRHGRKFEPGELVERATGEPMQYRSYVAYLKRKFGDIYGL
jgi:carboxypeptidase Taq